MIIKTRTEEKYLSGQENWPVLCQFQHYSGQHISASYQLLPQAAETEA
jgi:hypothetical protein